MTPKRIEALRYFAPHPNGVAWLGRDGPTRQMLQACVRDGFIEVVKPPGGVGMIRWKLSAIGRARLGI